MIPGWYRKECENFGLDADEVIKQINSGVDSFNQYCKDNELDAKAYHVSDINKAHYKWDWKQNKAVRL